MEIRAKTANELARMKFPAATHAYQVGSLVFLCWPDGSVTWADADEVAGTQSP